MIYRRQVSIPSCVIALSLALLLLLGSARTIHAADVGISDDASVLNINKIKTEANKFSRSVSIFTTTSFTMPDDADWIQDEGAKARYQKALLPTEFDAHTKEYMSEHGAGVAIGIDVKDRYVSIQSEDDVPLSSKEAKYAVSIFQENFANNDYTTALLATLKNLSKTISMNENAQFWNNLWTAVKWIGIVGVLILIGVMSKVFGWSSSDRNGRYYHHHSSYSGGSSSSSSSSSSSDSGGSSGGGSGGFF